MQLLVDRSSLFCRIITSTIDYVQRSVAGQDDSCPSTLPWPGADQFFSTFSVIANRFSSESVRTVVPLPGECLYVNTGTWFTDTYVSMTRDLLPDPVYMEMIAPIPAIGLSRSSLPGVWSPSDVVM